MWIEYLIFIITTSVLSIWVYCKLSTGYCKSSQHLVGKTAIVTGANTGIGFETAKDFAERGARVIIACRNETKGITARDIIRTSTRNKDVHFRILDLSSFDSVRKFAKEINETEQYLHIIVNNAGCCPDTLERSKDGLLLGMQTNYFSPFLLTTLLIPKLQQSAPSRIINVSSFCYAYGYIDLENLNMQISRPFLANHFDYTNSKLCSILITKAFVRRLKGSNVTINSLHPGIVKTNMINVESLNIGIVLKLLSPFWKSPRAGAQTSIYLAVSPDVDGVSGSYFQDCREVKPVKKARDFDLAEKLWCLTEQIVSEKPYQNFIPDVSDNIQ